MIEKLNVVFLLVIFVSPNSCTLSLVVSCARLTFTLSQTLRRKATSSVRVTDLKRFFFEGVRKRQKHLQQGTRHCKKFFRKSDIVKRSKFWGMFRSQSSTITVSPATPVFLNPVLEGPDMGCIFPEMRFEDRRFASYRGGQNSRVNQFATTLAADGYYYDEIHQDVRCFCCGAVFNNHLPRCRETRERCNISFNQCWSYRQESHQSLIGLLTIVSSPLFTLRDLDQPRGQARAKQHMQSFCLPSVMCLSCNNNPHNEVLYSCRHRARTCERCCPEQDLCPYCHRGTLNNPLMTEYRRRTSLQTSRNARRCLLCSVRSPNILLLPCLHLIICSMCNRTTHCFRCGARIQGFVETLE